MEVIIQPDQVSANRMAAVLVANVINTKRNSVLGLATGSTPVGLYRELAEMHRAGLIDFSGVTTFNLDEYLGLAPSHPQSYRQFMQKNLFSHINMSPDRIHIPDGLTTDFSRECQAYEEAIRLAGGIDIQVLGIGRDGHIGFNEPSSSLASRTRVKTLTEETVRDNARFFNDISEVPRHCITMGLGTIAESRSIILLAFGEGKAEIVARAVEGPVTSMVPASALQFHPDVKIFLDEPAASRLERRAYYEWVYKNKPD